jgi:hypothetical protein
MQFTGNNTLYLPQVNQFSFLISGIDVFDTGVVNFQFNDTGSNYFNFQLSGGYVTTDRIISTYNTVDLFNIYGYIANNILNYQINNINYQKTVPFENLNSLIVSGGANPTNCSIFINSNPINANLSFNSTYNYTGLLTGFITSDTVFSTPPPSFLFYNSNLNFLTNTANYLTINTGVNYFYAQDTDSTIVEYVNNFYASINPMFGIIGNKFSPNRVGISNQTSLFLSDINTNNYYQTSLFNGIWNGNNFTYVDNPTNYNLSFNLGGSTLVGDFSPSTLFIQYAPIYPSNNSSYVSQYITGFNLTNSGLYSGVPPTINFNNYYYVTGLNKSFESFLFSTGCSNSILTTFTGGLPSGNASGYLNLVNVYLSGIYGVGVNSFKAANSYTILNSGSGYQSAPNLIFATGGNCYSVPDYSGIQSGQFKYVSGYGAVGNQAAGLTGYPLTSGITGSNGNITGYEVTGITLTNIGYGYSSSYPAKITFTRGSSDQLTNNASGNFSYKSTGLYNFTGSWNMTYNIFSTGYTTLPELNGLISGSTFMSSGQNNINLALSLTGLDNTSPISGLLTLYLSGVNQSLTTTKTIYQSRVFNLNTGALLPNAFVNYTYPLSDNISAYSISQVSSQYISSLT